MKRLDNGGWLSLFSIGIVSVCSFSATPKDIEYQHSKAVRHQCLGASQP